MSGFLLMIPVILFLFYMGLIFESTGITLLAYGAALVGVLSFIYLLLIIRKVSVRVMIPIEIAERGQTFTMRVEVHNKSILPIGKLSLYVEYGEGHDLKKKKIVLKFRNLPIGNSTWNRVLSIKLPGYYEFTTYKIKIHDMLGFFWMGKKTKSIAATMILPEISEVMVKLGDGVKHFHGETELFDDTLAGLDQSEILGVREFRDGDKLQNVHWKLSARMDNLVVKENSLPKSCAIVIFMPTGDMARNGSLDYVASLSYTLMDLKCGHYLAWNSRSTNDLARMRVNDEESFYLALITFMRDTSADCGEERLDRYREKYRGEPYLHSVFMDDKGYVSIDGTLPVKVAELREEILLR